MSLKAQERSSQESHGVSPPDRRVPRHINLRLDFQISVHVQEPRDRPRVQRADY